MADEGDDGRVSMEHSRTEEGEWWLGAVEEDTLSSTHLLLGDLLQTFLPPPPRPAFLQAASSCDWSWQEVEVATKAEGDALDKANGTTSLDNGNPQELGWVLVVVSIVSAVLGAIIMVTAIQCRNRLKNNRSRGQARHGIGPLTERHAVDKGEPHSQAEEIPTPQMSIARSVWMWLTAQRMGCYDRELRSRVERRHHCTPENHYTLSSMGRSPPAAAEQEDSDAHEAIYAELDHENDTSPHDDPSYQNVAYLDDSETDPAAYPCRRIESQLSSAYYSDISAHGPTDNVGWEATYEAIDTEVRPPVAPSPNAPEAMPSDDRSRPQGASITAAMDAHGACSSKHPPTETVPSNYV